ncbi:DUF427 domain-containing protein [soil metagenome]
MTDPAPAPDSQPAAASVQVGHYPIPPVSRGHTTPVAKRVRAVFDGVTVLDTVRALYVWEQPYYPQFYIPAADVRSDLLEADGRPRQSTMGLAQTSALVHRDRRVERVAAWVTESAIEGVAGTYRFEWDSLDAWFEEDEEVFLHPRSPYVRVDSMRSTSRVRFEKDGVVVAESASPVMLFETGLPRRWYLNKTDINWEHLRESQTQTRCPYKGTTSGYWSVVIEDSGRASGSSSKSSGGSGDSENGSSGNGSSGTVYADLAWSYDFPTRECAPIAGLVCFYDDKLDVFVDGIPQD